MSTWRITYRLAGMTATDAPHEASVCAGDEAEAVRVLRDDIVHDAIFVETVEPVEDAPDSHAKPSDWVHSFYFTEYVPEATLRAWGGRDRAQDLGYWTGCPDLWAGFLAAIQARRPYEDEVWVSICRVTCGANGRPRACFDERDLVTEVRVVACRSLARLAPWTGSSDAWCAGRPCDVEISGRP